MLLVSSETWITAFGKPYLGRAPHKLQTNKQTNCKQTNKLFANKQTNVCPDVRMFEKFVRPDVWKVCPSGCLKRVRCLLKIWTPCRDSNPPVLSVCSERNCRQTANTAGKLQTLQTNSKLTNIANKRCKQTNKRTDKLFSKTENSRSVCTCSVQASSGRIR